MKLRKDHLVIESATIYKLKQVTLLKYYGIMLCF